MVIVYPRTFPENEMNMQECWMKYNENVVHSTSGKGLFINSTQIARPTWELNVTSGLLTLEKAAMWSAWRKSLRGLKEFLAFDVRRAYPLFYPSARSPADISAGWSGTATVSSVGLSGVLGLTGLPAGYKIGAGDRIGLEQAGYYGYYEVVEDATANGSGAVTVTVAPLLHSVFTTAAVARIWQAKAKFRLDWTSWSESGDKQPTPISFRGIQRL